MDLNHLIGQRFNLISKSDIRYVGTLHEINPEASTIALENVVSHGTEGRRGNPAEEIAPSASVYEYIVFRGSDVKDISVAEDQKEDKQSEPPQVPNDPAILGSGSRPVPPQGPPSSQPPQTSGQGPRQQPPPGYPQQHQPPFQGYYPPYNRPMGPPGYPPGPGFPHMPYGAPPGWYPPPGQGFPPPPPGQFPHPQMPIGPPGPHRAGGPPGPMNAPKPTSELPVGEKPVSRPTSNSNTPTPAPIGQNVPTPPIQSKPTVSEVKGVSAALSTSQVPAATAPAPAASSAAVSEPTKILPTGPRNGPILPAIPIAVPHQKPVIPQATAPSSGPAAPGPAQNARATTAAIQDATRAATAAVAAAMAKLPQPPSKKQQAVAESAVDGLTKRIGEMKTHDSIRGGRGGQQNSRGARGAHRGTFHQTQGKKVEVPTTDYDFESANAKFNKQDLVKEAIATGSPMGEIEADPLDGAPAEANGSADSPTVYNKSSSFFDNISSESRDREEGTGGRAGGREWRGEEEKKNIETFGQGSVDGGYRGGYRGRGRGRGYGGRGRGGYNRGYNSGGRGRGGFRGGRGASQATGVPAQT